MCNTICLNFAYMYLNVFDMDGKLYNCIFDVFIYFKIVIISGNLAIGHDKSIFNKETC